MSNMKSNAIVVGECNKRLNALKGNVGAKALIAMNGEKHKLSQVTAVYQACLDAHALVEAKRTELQQALAARTDAEQAVAKADSALRKWVPAEFGVGSREATEF